jgi:hypothetical protein
MWLNIMFLTFASLCVGFILGWVMARPRRWGAFGGDIPGAPGALEGPGGSAAVNTSDIPGGDHQTGVGLFARRT